MFKLRGVMSQNLEGLITPVELMKALADETRLTSIVLLLEAPMCVCDLMAQLALSQPKVSRHLALLRDVGLVTTERRGQWVYYSVANNLPAWVINTFAELREPTLQATNIPETGGQSECC